MLVLPVPSPQTPVDESPVGDPFLAAFGAFLQAAIRRRCQTAWSAIGGATDVVERVETNDPTDNTFTTAKLPCLALWRSGEGDEDERIADDLYESKSDIIVRWIAPLAVQKWKANREAFSRAIRAAVAEAIKDERTPGWKVWGDTDPFTPTRGSCITDQLSLMRQILSFKTREEMLKIEMDGLPDKNFPSIKFTFPISESLDTTQLGIYDAKLDAAVGTNDPITVTTIEIGQKIHWDVP
jgi:hypothetical protein